MVLHDGMRISSTTRELLVDICLHQRDPPAAATTIPPAAAMTAITAAQGAAAPDAAEGAVRGRLEGSLGAVGVGASGTGASATVEVTAGAADAAGAGVGAVRSSSEKGRGEEEAHEALHALGSWLEENPEVHYNSQWFEKSARVGPQAQ